MEDCLFCKIIAGEVPSTKVYEDEHSYAFLDITPVAPGHVLLVPKEHARNLFDVSEDTLKNTMPALKKLTRAVKEATNADGINIHVNNEPAAGQAVFHLHFHIIPRFADDELKMWHGKEYDDSKNMEIIAEKIQGQLS